MEGTPSHQNSPSPYYQTKRLERIVEWQNAAKKDDIYIKLLLVPECEVTAKYPVTVSEVVGIDAIEDGECREKNYEKFANIHIPFLLGDSEQGFPYSIDEHTHIDAPEQNLDP
jgi:hypothetical protein